MIVTVLYNLPESDRESDQDTEISAEAVTAQLAGAGYATKAVGIHPDEVHDLHKITGSDFVFNLVEWDGDKYPLGVETIKSLERIGVPYSGSNPRGYKLSADKMLMKAEMKKNGIPTPGWRIWYPHRGINLQGLKYPVIVKLEHSHCGEGITQDSVAGDVREAELKAEKLGKTYNQPVLVEEYIEGRELHVTVLEKNGRPWILPPAEVSFRMKKGFLPILTYDMKWREDSPEYSMAGYMLIPELPEEISRQVDHLAKVSYIKLGGRDYPRLDMRVRDGTVYVLEINNNPGIDFEPDSGIGASARAAGFTFPALLVHIVENARLRFVNKYDTVTV